MVFELNTISLNYDYKRSSRSNEEGGRIIQGVFFTANSHPHSLLSPVGGGKEGKVMVRGEGKEVFKSSDAETLVSLDDDVDAGILGSFLPEPVLTKLPSRCITKLPSRCRMKSAAAAL